MAATLGASGAPSAPATARDLIAARRATCPACASEDRDDGDGFCAECGHRLVFASGAPSIPPTEIVGRWAVREARAPDDFEARGAYATDPGRALVVVGVADALSAEAAALEGMAGDSRFPAIIERSIDARWGPYLALHAPPRGARPLVEAARVLSVDDALGIVRQAFDIAERVERARFDWTPMRSDAFLDDHGQLFFARLRSGRRLGQHERLDGRGITEAIGGALLPEPGTRGSPRLVRLLSAHYVVEADRPCTLESERAELEAVSAELAARPRGDDRSRAALLTDRGMKRAYNEDAASVEMGDGWTVLVTCDGVSSSSHARIASDIASTTACATLAHIVRTRAMVGSAGLQAVSSAVRAAHAAVCAHKYEPTTGEPPGTTIVVAFVHDRRAVVAWVGDSRAYWITRDGGALLTRDHTWLNEAIETGDWTEEEAIQQPLAHALTRCLGPLEWGGAGTVDPDVCTRLLDEPGFLVLCSDGLWNYLPTPAELARVIDPTMGASEASERLVNHALSMGAHDNVTVALYRHR